MRVYKHGSLYTLQRGSLINVTRLDYEEVSRTVDGCTRTSAAVLDLFLRTSSLNKGK